MPSQSLLDFNSMFGKWSVILTVADTQTVYSLVQGEHPEAVFVGSKKQCLKYIRDVSGDD